jgi:hypothetical protein
VSVTKKLICLKNLCSSGNRFTSRAPSVPPGNKIGVTPSTENNNVGNEDDDDDDDDDGGRE